jgi:hypothetical protein
MQARLKRDLSCFLQSPTSRERAERQQAAMAALPSRIGPAEFRSVGALVAVRCPHDLDRLLQKAGGLWEPGSRRWLIEPRRINPLIRDLRRATDPLFRRAGIDLDGKGNRDERPL